MGDSNARLAALSRRGLLQAVRLLPHHRSHEHAVRLRGARLFHAAHHGPYRHLRAQRHHRHPRPHFLSALSHAFGHFHDRHPRSLLGGALLLRMPASACGLNRPRHHRLALFRRRHQRYLRHLSSDRMARRASDGPVHFMAAALQAARSHRGSRRDPQWHHLHLCLHALVCPAALHPSRTSTPG